MSNRKRKIGYRMRPVWSEEPRFVDSAAMTASQMADGSHTLRILLVDEVNRQSAFYRFLYLTERRKEIDRKYDYRYSQLTHVFGRLLYEGRLGEEELGGLGEDKLKSIRSFAKFLAEDRAA